MQRVLLLSTNPVMTEDMNRLVSKKLTHSSSTPSQSRYRVTICFEIGCEGCIDPFPKRHRLVHNGGFPTFEALYCSPNMVNSTEIS